MAKALIVSMLLVLALPSGAAAKDKNQAEVVEVYTLTQMASQNRKMPGTPETSVTTCTGISGIYSREYGSRCVTTITPATEGSVQSVPTEIHVFDGVKVVMPDGSHFLLMCERWDKGCGSLVDKTTDQVNESCKDLSQGTEYELNDFCTYSAEGATILGMFRVERKGNMVTIWGWHGKRVYEVGGTF
jgi:hypothetical protein